MTWHIDLEAEKPKAVWGLKPQDVLYFLDGPQIFRASFGFLDVFCLKLEDLEESFLWLCAQISDEIYGLIAADKLSVRAGFSKPEIWIVETDYSMNVSRYWLCSLDDLDESMLPECGISVSGKKGVPDHLEQAKAFFAFHYKGQGIGNYDVQFSRYKTIVNNSYDSARKILAPVALAGYRSSVFDFRVKTAPGSVIIAVERPTFNAASVSHRLSTSLSSREISERFLAQRNAFFTDIELLVSMVETNNFDSNSADSRYAVMRSIYDVIPSGNNDLTSVTFTASGIDYFGNVTINERVGKIIHDTYDDIARKSQVEAGKIEIINSNSLTLVLLSEKSHKQVTCHFSSRQFDLLSDTPTFRNGSRIEVEGKVQKRSVRNMMSVNTVLSLRAE